MTTKNHTLPELMELVKRIDPASDDQKIVRALRHCVYTGKVKNVSQGKNPSRYKWTGHIETLADAAGPIFRPPPPAPTPTPPDCWEPPAWTRELNPTRPGAMDFRACPSRRGDDLVPLKPPISMAGQSRVPPYFMSKK